MGNCAWEVETFRTPLAGIRGCPKQFFPPFTTRGLS